MHPKVSHVPTKKRLVTRVLLCALGLVAAYLLFTRAPIPFVKSWWQAGEHNLGDDWHRRHRIADWMVLTGSLIGATRAEVVAKLGEPTHTSFIKDWPMKYILGDERGLFSIDSEWLALRFDREGRVSEATIARD